jgi:uncharacterized membrane protein
MRFGKKITNFFHRIGEAIFGVRKLPGKLKKTPKKKKVMQKLDEVPKALSGFFERHHASWSEYVMLKVQIAIVALFVLAAIYVVLLPTHEVFFLVAPSVLSAYALYLALTQLKRAFERDYPAYRSFVFMCIAIAWVFMLMLRYLPVKFSFESLGLAFVPALVVISLVLVTFIGFRLRYGRDYTYGVVEDAGRGRAVVRVSYDICSNVKHGSYVVESLIKVKKGDVVKVKVERPMLGLRGAKVKAILGKVN